MGGEGGGYRWPVKEARLFSLVPVLCGWYLYLAVLALLQALSARARSWLGLLSIGGVVVALLEVVWLYWPGWVPAGWLPWLQLGGAVYLVAIGLLGLAFGGRQDTRLIGLLLAGAALLPIVLYFYQPEPPPPDF